MIKFLVNMFIKLRNFVQDKMANYLPLDEVGSPTEMSNTIVSIILGAVLGVVIMVLLYMMLKYFIILAIFGAVCYGGYWLFKMIKKVHLS